MPIENIFDIICDPEMDDCEKHDEVLSMLYDEDVDDVLDLDFIDHRKDEGYTPLIASVVHETQLMFPILCKGCNVQHQDNNGQTALHHACIQGRFRVMEFLLYGDWTTGANIRDNYGKTAMHYFCEAENWLVEHCFSKNWLVDIMSFSDNGPSKYEDFFSNMGRLCFHDKNPNGQNPLHILCQNHHFLDSIDFLTCALLETSIHQVVNVRDNDGQTPLHLGIMNTTTRNDDDDGDLWNNIINKRVVDLNIYLIKDMNAQFLIPNKNNKTAWELAVDLNLTEVVDAIEEKYMPVVRHKINFFLRSVWCLKKVETKTFLSTRIYRTELVVVSNKLSIQITKES